MSSFYFESDAMPSTSSIMPSMAFRQLLKALDDGLGSEDCHKLKFLSADLGIPKTKLEHIKLAADIFDELEKKMSIAADEVGLLWELMNLIHRKDLLKIIEAYCSKNPVKENSSGSVPISDYRLLLLTIADNTSSSELNCMKQACKDLLARQAVSKIKDVYQLFSLLEERELLAPHNLKFLYNLLDFAGNKQMAEKIKTFLSWRGPSDAELLVLCSKLSSEWQKLATFLGLEYHIVQGIEAERRPIADKVMDMLITWRQTVPSSNDAYAQLCQALKLSGRNDLATLMASYANTNRQMQAQRSQVRTAPLPSPPRPLYNPNVAQPHLMKPSDFQAPSAAASSMVTHSRMQEMGSFGQQIDDHGLPEHVLRELSDHIIVEWKKMGTFLSLEYATIRQIDEDYMRSGDKAFNMLLMWRNSLPRGSDAVAKLAAILKTVGRVDLSERLRGISPPSVLWATQLGHHENQQQPASQALPQLLNEAMNTQPASLTDAIPDKLNEPSSENVTVQLENMDIEERNNSQQERTKEAVQVEEGENTHSGYAVIQESLPRYKMDRNPRGLCMIINNFKFHGNKNYKDRPGSDVDAGKVDYLFNKLHFLVYLKENLSANDMYRWFKDVSQMDHSHYDCFACCILSHGALGVVHGSDCQPVEIQDILKLFKAISCDSLKGKPKMFFIQACQGTVHQDGVPIETDEPLGIGHGMPKTLPNEADFLMSYATVPGYVSYRSATTGTWFIDALVDEMTKHHDQHDIIKILTIVNRRLSESNARLKIGFKKQMPAPSFTLLKELYLPSLTQ